jgi:hypothetical protein
MTTDDCRWLPVNTDIHHASRSGVFVVCRRLTALKEMLALRNARCIAAATFRASHRNDDCSNCSVWLSELDVPSDILD